MPRSTKTTVLFDLDGTLIPLNDEEYFAVYFERLERYGGTGLSRAALEEHIYGACYELIKKPNFNRLNSEAFFEALERRIGLTREQLAPRLAEFYGGEGYGGVSKCIVPSTAAQRTVSLLKDKGYTLCLATNPLYPEIAVRRRVGWGGIDPDNFALITHFDNMHAAKPHVEYYKEIAAKLGAVPSECYMVGNDVKEDILPAQRSGMSCFFLKERPIWGDMEPDCPGGLYGDLYEWAQKLPPVLR